MILHRGQVQLGGTRFVLWNDGRLLRSLHASAIDALDGKRPGVDDGGLPPVWQPVTWGERRYLVSGRQIVPFCIAAAEGREPRSERVGRFYLRENDETKPVAGRVPVEECKGPLPPLKVN
jgi:hypothetical protein